MVDELLAAKPRNTSENTAAPIRSKDHCHVFHGVDAHLPQPCRVHLSLAQGQHQCAGSAGYRLGGVAAPDRMEPSTTMISNSGGSSPS